MTVAEAIEELKKLPPDLPLHYVTDDFFGGTDEINSFVVTEDKYNLPTPFVMVSR